MNRDVSVVTVTNSFQYVNRIILDKMGENLLFTISSKPRLNEKFIYIYPTTMKGLGIIGCLIIGTRSDSTVNVSS